jgi:hypothetical protein
MCKDGRVVYRPLFQVAACCGLDLLQLTKVDKEYACKNLKYTDIKS